MRQEEQDEERGLLMDPREQRNTKRGSIVSLNKDDEDIERILGERRYQYILAVIGDSKESNPIVTLRIHGKLMKAYIDDGSEISLLSKKRWQDIGKPYMKESDVKARNTNTEVPIIGQSKINLEIPGKSSKEEVFYIVEDLTSEVITGRSYLKQYQTFKHDYKNNCIFLGPNKLPIWFESKRSKLVLKANKDETIAPGSYQDFPSEGVSQ
uniref:RVP domain-containing protein n=1 Tax=Strongyloides papillosus TaxID=174720 RepID=A0A0N5C2T7_STREA